MSRTRVAVAVAVLLLTNAAFAQRARPSAPAPMSVAPSIFAITPEDIAAAIAPCMFMLNLTEAQTAQVRDILAAGQTTIQPLVLKLRADHDALLAAAAGTSPNACSVGAAYLAQQADAQLLDAQLRTVQGQVESVLTPEQKARLEGCASAIQKLFPPKP